MRDVPGASPLAAGPRHASVGRSLVTALSVLAPVTLLTFGLSFGLSTMCTNDHSCTDTWCSPCRVVNWVPLIYLGAQVLLAAVASAATLASDATQEGGIRRAWLVSAATLTMALLAWAILWAS